MSLNIVNSFQTIGAVGGWKEAGRTLLGVAGDAVSVVSLPPKRYFQLLWYPLAVGTYDSVLTLNSDVGLNYSERRANNGGADATVVNQADILIHTNETTPVFGTYFLDNLALQEKLLQGETVRQSVAGAGTATNRFENYGKHAQITNPIDTITMNNTNTGDYAIGSELVVLEWDPNDTHSDNFWEQLASVTTTGALATVETPIVTPKKYNWIQVYGPGFSIASNHQMRLGTTTIDTGLNYAGRRSLNNATDSAQINQDDIRIHDNLGDDWLYANLYFVNLAGQEKLITGHSVAGVDGVNNAPNRFDFSGKWADTNLADIFQIAPDSGTFDVGTKITWWGHD